MAGGVGHGGFRLSRLPEGRAVAGPLPTGGPEGVWYLIQPVSGRWERSTRITKAGGPPRQTRRSQQNVTAWRHFLLESDHAPADLWLRVLARLPLPITAIYTSGGRSIHALVRHEVDSKARWDAVRDGLRRVLCPLGADPAALSAVRLSRLPGCRRGEHAQRLLFLDSQPDGVPLLDKPLQRP